MKSIWKIGLIIFSMLAVISCAGPESLLSTTGKAVPTGTLEISIKDTGRTLIPSLSMDVGEYKAVFTKASVQTSKTITAAGSASLALEAGDWQVQIDAYNKDVPAVKIGSGSAAFQVVTGLTTTVHVTVVPMNGQGTLNLSVLWTGLTLGTPLVEAVLTPQAGGNGQTLPFTNSGTGATSSNSGLNAGYYLLDLGLYDGQSLIGNAVEAVRIVEGVTTLGTFSFSSGGADGSVNVTVTVDLKLPMDISISGVSSAVEIGSVINAAASSSQTGVTWEWYLNGVKQNSSLSTLSLTTGVGAGALGLGTYRLDAFASKGDILSSNYVIFSVASVVLPPTVSASPGTSDFLTDGIEVTLSGSNPAGGQYKIGTGAWIDFTSGAKVTLGAGLTSGQTVALSLKNGAATADYVYTKKVQTGTVVGFKKPGSAAPSLWLWETAAGGRAIMTLEGKTWPGPGMTAAAETDWWTWTIPESYKPLGALSFKFDSGAQIDLTLADLNAGKTWYNGTSWQVKPVPVAAVPKIVVTPAGGYFDPAQDVSITILDDPVAGATTAASYKINGGVSVVITGGAANLNLSATAVLSVSATNSAGTSTADLTFTKGQQVASGFSWDNASVYFVITDRFFNGNAANDSSYGRVKVDGTGKNIGTFHGGDIAGLKAKIDANYFTDLGVNAIWLTAPYEQMHGFVSGGNSGDFAHYAYHGYYTLDYSNIDASMGTKEEFKAFVDAAHTKGIRVVLDIVMNHSGYLSLKDMDDFNMGGKKAGFTSNWTPSAGQTWSSYHDLFVDYTASGSTGWGRWWGGAWVRAGLPGYPGDVVDSNSDPIKGNLASLPDFRTENDTAVSLPAFLQEKATYGGAFSAYSVNKAKTQKVREWTAEWLTQWVREYGIDGFRVDTAKHVERTTWAYLKDQSVAALKAWRLANPSAPGASWTDDFWTTAEVFDHGQGGFDGDYHGTGKFDSIINFGFTGVAASDFGSVANTYASYASAINGNKTDKWNYLSFIDNHDKGNVFYNGDSARQIKAGTALLLAPGGVQIYYGDEYGRANGDNGSDKDQGSRSDYVWSDASGRGAATLTHWQKIGQFRSRHSAVGGGDHAGLAATSGNAFSRVWGADKVAVVIGASGTVDVTVSSLFADGTVVKNAYDNTTVTVAGGKAAFSAGTNGVILIEKN